MEIWAVRGARGCQTPPKPLFVRRYIAVCITADGPVNSEPNAFESEAIAEIIPYVEEDNHVVIVELRIPIRTQLTVDAWSHSYEAVMEMLNA